MIIIGGKKKELTMDQQLVIRDASMKLGESMASLCFFMMQTHGKTYDEAFTGLVESLIKDKKGIKEILDTAIEYHNDIKAKQKEKKKAKLELLQ